jgi:hypothetical protein
MIFHKIATLLVWVSWKLLAFAVFFLTIPALPWIGYLFYKNFQAVKNKDYSDFFMLDWGLKPQTKIQWFFYRTAVYFRPFFEIWLECVCKD